MIKYVCFRCGVPFEGYDDVCPHCENHDQAEPVGKEWATSVVEKQIAMSRVAFGPGARTHGLRAHIAKELDEIARAPFDVEEWIDVMILAMDGAWRAAQEKFPFADDVLLARLVAGTLVYKIGKNARREWPDWREVGQDAPIEHKRLDEGPTAATTMTCGNCKGSGQVTTTASSGAWRVPCRRCKGSGRVTISTSIPDDSFGNGY